MRTRVSPVVLPLALALALPGFASTVRHPATASRIHHRRHAAVHQAAATAASPRSRTAAYHPVSAHRTLTPLTVERHATIPTLAKIPFVPPLRGSRESLLRQNVKDTEEGLVRIQDDDQLNALRADRELVMLPASSALAVNPGLPFNRRYCRPWTARFLSDLSQAHYERFHRSLQVNSAVRTVDFQRSLMLVNGNAAAAEGDMASPHLTGAAIDIGKKGLTTSEIAWMRAWLLPLQTAGKIDVEEEFYQACFHISVYKLYAPPLLPRAPRKRASATLLATRVP
jgi:hypothetical protein